MISYKSYYAFQAVVNSSLASQQPARVTRLLQDLSTRLASPIKFKEGVFFEEFPRLASAAHVLQLAGYAVPEGFKLYSNAHLGYGLFLCGLLEEQVRLPEDQSATAKARWFVTKALVEVEYQGRCLSLSEFQALQGLIGLLDL